MEHGKVSLVFLAIVTVAVTGVSKPCWAAAGTVPWVKRPPTIEQLTGGKVHTGEKITAQNVNLVAPYLLQSFVRDVKNGASFTIAPYTPTTDILEGPRIKATIANAGKDKISANGTVTAKDGKPWTGGGFPVEFPKNGLEVMVNQIYQYADQGDNRGDELWINPAGETYKVVNNLVGEFNMNGRSCVKPFGIVPGHEGEIRRDLIYDLAPYDVRGIAVLTIEYVDQSKLPNSWGYIPVLRRVQRFSSKQRYDSVDGSDLRAGDLNGFSDPLSLWSFKILARKPMLFPMSPGYPQARAGVHPKLVKGKYAPNMKMEVRDVYLIKAVPKVDYIYSKKILEVDAGTYLSLGDFYDKQGKLWIAFEPFFEPTTDPCGPEARALAYIFRNFQTGSVTFIWITGWRFNDPAVHLDEFTLRYISTRGR